MRKLVALIAVSTLALAACSQNETAESDPEPSAALVSEQLAESIDAALAEAMAEYEVPGAVVAVCDAGGQEWVTTAGVTDLESQEPMTEELIWPLRSVTKSFTVTAILELADQGELSLDDTIDQYVDGVPNGDEITLRQLADMTSGAPEYTTQAWIEDYSADPERAFTMQELIDYALAEPAQFEPGAEHVYTNSNTVLLGAVVEEVSGKPFPQALQELVLDQVDLPGTEYEVAVDEWGGDHPTGYQPGTEDLEPQDNNFTVFSSAGAMTSTISDMCEWGATLGEGSLLESETQAARVAGTPLDKGPEYDTYGQGMGTLEGWVGHTGEGFGHTVLIMHNRQTGVNVAVGMNVSSLGDHVPTKFFRQAVDSFDQAGSTGS